MSQHPLTGYFRELDNQYGNAEAEYINSMLGAWRSKVDHSIVVEVIDVRAGCVWHCSSTSIYGRPTRLELFLNEMERIS